MNCLHLPHMMPGNAFECWLIFKQKILFVDIHRRIYRKEIDKTMEIDEMSIRETFKEKIFIEVPNYGTR